MNEARASRVEQVFAQVAAMARGVRTLEVRRLCEGDAEVEREVLDLLQHLEDSQFLDPEQFARDQAGLVFEGVLPVAARIGQYTVLGVLGAGGMGTVYLAEQARPRRQVALKVISGPVARGSMVARFEREADLLGRLSHPGIAQIFEAGVADYGLGPRPFIAMERIDGAPLTRFARDRALGPRECVEIVSRVADAVEHAHQRGVIHRDLKPGNVLVGADGAPKVVDFGVARAVDDEFEGVGATGTGGILGTLAYMAPEQVRDPRSVDTRADVYALGVLLFEMLTGRQPHDCRTGALEEVIKRVCDEPAPRLGEVDRKHRGELETVVACALEKDRERRYRSAAEFADDLRRWLAGEPIAARRDRLVATLRRSAVRNRRLVVGAGVALAGAIVVGAMATAQAAKNARLAAGEREARERAVLALDLAQRERSRADDEAERLRRSLYTSNIGFAQAALAAGDVRRVRRLLDMCPEDLRGWEWSYLEGSSEQSEGAFRVHGEGIVFAAADAERGRFVSFWLGGEAVLRPLDLDGEARSFAIEGDVFRAAMSERTGALYLANSAGRLERIDLSRGDRIEIRGETGAAYGAMRPLDADDGLVVLQGRNILERLGADGESVWRRDDLQALSMDAGGELVVCGGRAGGVWALDAQDGTTRWSIAAPAEEVRGVAVSRDGAKVAAVTSRGVATLHDAGDGRVLWRTETGVARASALAMTRDGVWALVGAADGSIVVLDASSGQVAGRLRGHAGAITSICPIEGERFLTCARDGMVRWWEVREGLAAGDRTARVNQSGVSVLAPWGDNAFLALGFDGETAALVDGAAHEARVPSGPATMADEQPGGSLLAFAMADGTVTLRDMSGGVEDRVLTVSERRVVRARFSPDGAHIATVSEGGDLTIFDVRTGQEVSRVRAHELGATGVRWAPDGATIWSGGLDGALRRWALDPEGRIAPTPQFETVFSWGQIWDVALSPDGSLVATCGEDGAVWTVDVASGAATRWSGHVGPAYGVAFHPEDARLASVGLDGRVRVWDTVAGEELMQLGPGGPSLMSVAFSADGRTLAAGGIDGVVRLYRAPARTRE